MKSIIVVLPYFGKFPNYFNLFLKSCAANPTVNWLIVTDQELKDLNIPNNVIISKSSFHDLKEKCKERYKKDPIAPYSLCKYRVVYHELFSEYVKKYDFWGFCDCDLIFGNLRNLITEDILSIYDKISWRGHLTLFRNCEEVNNAYKQEISGFKTFKGCINDSEGINLFDEVGINKIFDKLGLKIYMDLPFADLLIRSNNFICQHDIFNPTTNVNQIFRWTEDGLYRIYICNNQVFSQPIAYVHFLKRPMKYEDYSIEKNNSFLIVPNKFVKDKCLSIEDILAYSKKGFYWSYYLPRMTPRFLFHKIVEKIRYRKVKPDVYEKK